MQIGLIFVIKYQLDWKLYCTSLLATTTSSIMPELRSTQLKNKRVRTQVKHLHTK